MKKSEAKSEQPVGETLAAPVQLTPQQLEIVAAGFRAALVTRDLIKGITVLSGAYPVPVLTKTFQF
jgi:hypothetical protein